MSFQIFNISIDGKKFEMPKKTSSHNNIISVLTGKNGSGKSRLLEFVVNNFKVSSTFLQKNPNNWNDGFNDYFGNTSKNQIFYMTNGNEISAHSISKELACGFISDDLIKDWRQVFPTKLICISTSPFDRFPLNNTAKSSYNDLYSYIGMKSARRNNSVKSLISNVVDTMFKKPNSIDTNIDVIKKL